MLGYLADLGQSFMLLARVDAEAGQTRIVKFSYEYDFDEEQPEARSAAGWRRVLAVSAEPFVRLATALGIADYRTWFGTPGMFDARSYHVEVACPDEITIPEAVLYRIEGGTHNAVSDDRRADRAHLSVHSPHPDDATNGYVVVRYCLRAALIVPVAVLTALTAGVITGGLALHYWFPGARRTDTAAALVVAIPTFFAAFVVPGLHRLVRRMFVGLRAVALLSGLCSFAAAATLALQLSPDSVAHIWIGLAAVAGTLAVVALLALFHSWWRTSAPPSPQASSRGIPARCARAGPDRRHVWRPRDTDAGRRPMALVGACLGALRRRDRRGGAAHPHQCAGAFSVRAMSTL